MVLEYFKLSMHTQIIYLLTMMLQDHPLVKNVE